MALKVKAASLRSLERSLLVLGAHRVARLDILLGLEHRFLRPHVLTLSEQYTPGHYEKAMKILGAPGRGSRDRMTALALKGRLLRVLNRKEEALDSFNQALRISPADARTRAWRGELRAHMTDMSEQGIEELEAVGRTFCGDPWPWIWSGAVRLATSAGPETFSALEAAVKADPHSVPALLLRAEAFKRAGDPRSSLADITRVIHLEPSCTGAYILRAGCEAELGHIDTAVATLAFASRLDPDIKNRYFDLLPPDNSSGGPVARLNAYIRRHPKAAWAYGLRGDALRNTCVDGDEPGMADLERAVKLDPQTPWLWACLARSRVQYIYPAEGKRDLRRALALDPECAWLHSWIGEAYRHAKRPDLAIKFFRRAIALDPAFAQVHVWLGRVYCDNGQWSRGIAEFSSALTLNADGFTYAKRGEALARLKQHRLAIANFDRALNFQIRNGREWIWKLRSQSRMAVGDYAGACDDLAKVARRPPYRTWVPLQREDTPTGPSASRALTAALLLQQSAVERNGDGAACAKRGETLARLKRHAAAILEFDRALNSKIGNGKARIWSLRSRSRMSIGDYAGACDDLTQVAHKHLQLSWVPLQFGEKRNARASREALTALDEAIVQHARASWLWAWKGAILLGYGRLEEGLAALDRCLQIEPSSAWAYGWRGRALWLNARNAGETDLNRALDLDADCPWLWSWRAELRLGQDKIQAALKDSARALELAPLDAHASYCRGEALRRLGKPREALASLDVAAKFDAAFVPTFISRGVILGEMGDYKGQLRDFRRVARVAPDYFRRQISAGKTKDEVEALIRSLLKPG